MAAAIASWVLIVHVFGSSAMRTVYLRAGNLSHLVSTSSDVSVTGSPRRATRPPRRALRFHDAGTVERPAEEDPPHGRTPAQDPAAHAPGAPTSAPSRVQRDGRCRAVDAGHAVRAPAVRADPCPRAGAVGCGGA